jgi:pullulanase/glycogen debranching enzyme
MARKVVNRKELREEAEAAEKLAADAPKKKKAKKKAAKRKSRAKETPQVRMKLFWGVFSQSMKRVALYDFTQKKEAEKKAKELSASGKSPHFVQKVKEAIEE